MSDPEIITLGCRLNLVESEVIMREAKAAGLSNTVILNTCAVTSEAVRQARQTIRKLRRERPGTRIIVTGCAAQIEPSRFTEMDEVDHVIGNAEKLAPATYQALAAGHMARCVVNDIASVRETAAHMLDGFAEQTRAFVEVQNGCDHRCTFCIIPFGRGPSRSVKPAEAVAEIRRLAEKGYNEIVLTGVDLTSYGTDLGGETSLGHLVTAILRNVPELPRLRLSSIDQVEADPLLIAAIADEPRLMPHLHLSLQSGSDMILKRMKRRHLRADAIRFCYEVRRLRPDVVFGADIIAGFPTETDPMFAETERLVEECGLTYLHVFPYSPRPGTPAARMPQVRGSEAKERAARLRRIGAARESSFLDRQIGTTTQILMERGGTGRTPHFAPVRFSTAAAPGTLARTHISARDGHHLIGVPA